VRVVSNTSPIINPAMVGCLDLLKQLYTFILIPDAVYDEIVLLGAGLPGAVEVQTEPWFRRQTITDTALLARLRAHLDEGEAAALTLAAEVKADLLLLDERAARRHAFSLGLRCAGLLGILLAAKRAGLLSNIKPVLDDLIANAGFWVSAPLYDQILRAAGE
jgi:predicted nucleic acid-binding protein